MIIREFIVIFLLAMAASLIWLCCFGLLVMRNPYDRLHATGPANVLAPVFVALAVVVHTGISNTSLKVLLIMVSLVFTNPIVTHAIARAARIRRVGSLKIDR